MRDVEQHAPAHFAALAARSIARRAVMRRGLRGSVSPRGDARVPAVRLFNDLPKLIRTGRRLIRIGAGLIDPGPGLSAPRPALIKRDADLVRRGPTLINRGPELIKRGADLVKLAADLVKICGIGRGHPRFSMPFCDFIERGPAG